MGVMARLMSGVGADFQDNSRSSHNKRPTACSQKLI